MSVTLTAEVPPRWPLGLLGAGPVTVATTAYAVEALWEDRGSRLRVPVGGRWRALDVPIPFETLRGMLEGEGSLDLRKTLEGVDARFD